MKKIFHIALSLSILLTVGCSPEVPEGADLTQYSNPPLSSTFQVLGEFDTVVDENLTTACLESACGEEVTKATYSDIIGVASGLLASFSVNKVHQVVGKYVSRDINGNKVEVSGKIIYPIGTDIKNYIIVSHYTIGSNAESPSESFSFEGLYALKGYAVIIADYVGYGITREMVHPYLQAQTCASNVIDMALAVKPFMESRNLKPKDNKVILLGYSQGGACTLHVQRLMETDPQYAGKFDIKINYAGSGPYHIAKTYDYCIKQDVTGIPCAIPMIVQGMSIGMDKPLEMSYFFREPLLSHYDEWLNSKKYTVSQISKLIGSNKLSEILTKNGVDRSKPETARFYIELLENSIPSDYYPEAPLFMFHSEDDQTVPFVNSQVMQRQFRNYCKDIEYDFGHYGNHQKGALKFILKVFKKLD